MKVLAIGGGSMGRRRLRDLLHLEVGEVVLFEPDMKRCQEVAQSFGICGLSDFDAAMAHGPEALSISTPPALHEAYVRKGMERRLHVFAELPFVLDAEALAKIAAAAPRYPAVLAVSHTIRYYPPFVLIRELLQNGAIGKPLYLEYSLGNHLADWHPYEDYRKFYASDVKLGGAGMDMILHELSPIMWWLGPIASVSARLSKVSSLDIAGPDLHDALLTFASGCRGYFHHDIIERGTVGRHIRIAGEDGTLEWHQNLPTIRLYKAADKANEEIAFSAASDWDAALAASREMSAILAKQTAATGKIPSHETITFKYESCYLREMRHFVDAARGRSAYTMATVAEELRTVRTFHAIVHSSEQAQELAVAEN